MRLVNLSILMSYIATRLSKITSLALLAAATILPTGSAQTNAGAAADPCVSSAMVRLLAREGNSVRVGPFTELVSQKPGSTENEKGIELAQVRETARTLREARNWFEKGARKGYAPAQVNLAVLSLAGWGTPPNAGTALYWLEEAARQGYTLAYFDLGILYLHGCGVRQDYREAFRQFEQGAGAGDSAAQTNLGYLYDQGLGVLQDRVQAAEWYRKAAESGVAQAQYNLADLYVRGEGVSRDEGLAFTWFEKAAQQSHTGARIMLGNLYAEGRGTRKDLRAAYAWLLASALQGDARGRSALESLEPRLTAFELEEAKIRVRSLLANSRRSSEIAVLH
jgi:TPR repeat protein